MHHSRVLEQQRQAPESLNLLLNCLRETLNRHYEDSLASS